MALTNKQIDSKLTKLPTGSDSESVTERDTVLQSLVSDLRGRGMKHEEVAERLGIGVVKAQVLSYRNEESPVDPTPKNVVKLRDKDEKSWGRIAAATGLSEPAVKKLYAEETGRSHREADLGRGGRPPKAAKPAAKKAKTASKKATTAKKRPAKKAATSKRRPAKKTAKKRTPKKAASKA